MAFIYTFIDFFKIFFMIFCPVGPFLLNKYMINVRNISHLTVFTRFLDLHNLSGSYSNAALLWSVFCGAPCPAAWGWRSRPTQGFLHLPAPLLYTSPVPGQESEHGCTAGAGLLQRYKHTDKVRQNTTSE